MQNNSFFSKLKKVFVFFSIEQKNERFCIAIWKKMLSFVPINAKNT